jgi:hypothetical protein
LSSDRQTPGDPHASLTNRQVIIACHCYC